MNPIVDLINAQQANIDTQKTFTLVLNNTGSNLEKLQLFGTLEDYTKAFIAPQGGVKTYSLQKTKKQVVENISLEVKDMVIPSIPNSEQLENLISDFQVASSDITTSQSFSDMKAKLVLDAGFTLENMETGTIDDNVNIKDLIYQEDLNFEKSKNYFVTTKFLDLIHNIGLDKNNLVNFGFANIDESIGSINSFTRSEAIADVQLIESSVPTQNNSNIIVDGNFNENLRATAVLPNKTIAGLWNYLLSKELTLKGIQFKLDSNVQANNNQFVELYEYSPFLTEPNFVKNIQAYKNGYQRQSNIYDIFGLNWQLDKLKYLTIPNFQGTTVITLFF